MTKNITLAIDEDLLDKARVLAAMRRTSVNELVRGFLQREVNREAHQASRAEAWGRVFDAADASAEARGKEIDDQVPLVDREELYGEVMHERGLL